MPAGTHGFGSIGFPGLADPDSMPTPQLPNPQQPADDLHRIAEKYDGQPVEDITVFNLAAGASLKRDFSQTPFSTIVVSVTTGTAKVFFGDYTSPNQAAATAHFQVPSGGAPFEAVFATLGRIVTVVNDPTAAVNALGTLTLARP